MRLVPTHRAKRLDGKSSMNFIRLVGHGLSAISVYGELVSVRLLVAIGVLVGACLVGLGVIVGLRFLTDLAVPGWATTAIGLLTIVLLQARDVRLPARVPHPRRPERADVPADPRLRPLRRRGDDPHPGPRGGPASAAMPAGSPAGVEGRGDSTPPRAAIQVERRIRGGRTRLPECPRSLRMSMPAAPDASESHGPSVDVAMPPALAAERRDRGGPAWRSASRAWGPCCGSPCRARCSGSTNPSTSTASRNSAATASRPTSCGPSRTPGPLFTVLHALFEPLTGLKLPGVRLVNLGFSFLAIAALGLAIRSRGVPHAFPKALALIAAPMIWGPIGTAMTEMPALAFFCTALALLFAALDRAGRGSSSAYPLAALAGLACAVAITGRQQFLMVPIASVVLWRRSTWRVGLIFALIAAGLPTPIFLAWGGLVPPAERRFEAGLSIAHGLTAFSFAGIIYCLYDVGWLIRRWKVVAAIVALTTAANVATGAITQHPFHMIAMKYLSPTALHYYALTTSGDHARLRPRVLRPAGAVRLGSPRRPGRAVRLHHGGGPARGLDQDCPHVRRPLHRDVDPPARAPRHRAPPDTYGKALRLALGCLGGALSLRAYLVAG